MDTGRGVKSIWEEGGSTRARGRSYLMEQISEGLEFTAQVEGLPLSRKEVRVGVDTDNR